MRCLNTRNTRQVGIISMDLNSLIDWIMAFCCKNSHRLQNSVYNMTSYKSETELRGIKWKEIVVLLMYHKFIASTYTFQSVLNTIEWSIWTTIWMGLGKQILVVTLFKFAGVLFSRLHSLKNCLKCKLNYFNCSYIFPSDFWRLISSSCFEFSFMSFSYIIFFIPLLLFSFLYVLLSFHVMSYRILQFSSNFCLFVHDIPFLYVTADTSCLVLYLKISSFSY